MFPLHVIKTLSRAANRITTYTSPYILRRPWGTLYRTITRQAPNVLSLTTRAQDEALQHHHLGRWSLRSFRTTDRRQEEFRRHQLQRSSDQIAEPSSPPLSGTGYLRSRRRILL
jgi:hypothetical protein